MDDWCLRMWPPAAASTWRLSVRATPACSPACWTVTGLETLIMTEVIAERPENETTRSARRDTLLSPRFYTTDFAALDRIDVSAIRADWDVLLEEFRRDLNK